MSRITRASSAAVGVLAATSLLTACGSSSSHLNAAPAANVSSAAATSGSATSGSVTSNSAPAGTSAAAGTASVPSAADKAAWSKYTFTVGDNGGDGSEALAKVTGAFKNAPYKVKFARFTYGPPLVQAAASGDIDLGVVGDVPPITGAATEFGFSIVGIAHYLDNQLADEDIIVPKGSPIHTLADLKGKRIAVPQGSSAHGLALLALKSVGLTPSDVTLEFLSPAAGATAFSSGKADAWSIWNPQAALAVKQGARVLAPGLPPIDQTSNYYVAPNKDLTDPDRKAALTDLFKRLAGEFAWADSHADQFAQALSQEEGISLSDAKTVAPTMRISVSPVQASDIQAEQALSDAFVQAGQIKKKVDISAISQNILPVGYNSLTAGGT